MQRLDIDMTTMLKLLDGGVEELIRMIIYDLTGQRVFYTLHHLFVTRNAVYLCVFDMRRLVDTGATELIDESAAMALTSARQSHLTTARGPSLLRTT